MLGYRRVVSFISDYCAVLHSALLFHGNYIFAVIGELLTAVGGYALSALFFKGRGESFGLFSRALFRPRRGDIKRRGVFSLNDNDSDSLIENISVAALRDNTVYYSDSVKNTFQLKPYVFPSVGALHAHLDTVLGGG